MTHIFTYGTLRRGEGNHPRLHAARFLGEATTLDPWWFASLGPFPAILSGPPPSALGSAGRPVRVRGEVYAVDAETLAALDRLEGTPVYYQRVPVKVRLDDGTTCTVEAYIMPPRALGGWQYVTPLPTGDWCER